MVLTSRTSRQGGGQVGPCLPTLFGPLKKSLAPLRALPGYFSDAVPGEACNRGKSALIGGRHSPLRLTEGTHISAFNLACS